MDESCTDEAAPFAPFVPRSLAAGFAKVTKKRSVLFWSLAVLVLVVLILSGTVGLIEGGRDADAAFQTWIIALSFFCFSSFLYLLPLLVEVIFKQRLVQRYLERFAQGLLDHISGNNRQNLRWRSYALLVSNAVVVFSCMLIARATLLFIHLLLIIGGFCWVWLCFVFCAWLVWKLCGFAQGPLLFEVLLASSRRRLLAPLVTLWLFCSGVSIALLFFKEKGPLGLPAEVGRLEYYLLTSIGGVMISALLCITILCACLLGGSSMVKALLYFPPAGENNRNPPSRSAGELLLRVLVLVIVSHLVAVAFIFFLVYGMVSSVIMLVARFALRGGAPPKSFQSEEIASSDHDSPRRARRAREKARGPRSCFDVIKSYSSTAFMLTFAFIKVLALICLFVFDIAFIQKYLAATSSRTFMLARSNLVCGRSGYASTFGRTPADCALLMGLNFDAFAFRRNGTFAGQCIGYWLPSGYNQAEYGALRDNTDLWNCMGFSPSVWEASDGWDFYVLAPAQSCDFDTLVSERRLANLTADGAVLGEETSLDQRHFYVYGTVGTFPIATGNMWRQLGADDAADRVQEFMQGVMYGMQNFVEVGLSVPNSVEIRCTALRRFTSAAVLVSSVMAVAVVAACDVLSVLAAAKDISSVYAAECTSSIGYVVTIARAQLLEQIALVLLQVTISSGVKLQGDALAIFKQRCGILVKEVDLSGPECPVLWHDTLDTLSAIFIYFSFGAAIAIVLLVFSGKFYGLKPARWMVRHFYGDRLQLTSFAIIEPQLDKSPQPSTSSQPSTRLRLKESRTLRMDQTGSRQRWGEVLRPFYGFAVTLGIWTSRTTSSFHVGIRQDWYQPKGMVEQDEDGKLTDWVTWKSMFQASSKLIALVWLPFPYAGGIGAKCTEYLNNTVIFSFGKDGDLSKVHDEQLYIRKHFEGDTPRCVQILFWVSNAGQLVILLAMQFDLLGESSQVRIEILTALLWVVVAIAVIRVALDLARQIRMFVQTRGLVDFVEDAVEDGEPGHLLEATSRPGGSSQSGSGEGEFDMCAEHRQLICKACAELQTLKWIQERRLPKEQRGLLVSNRGKSSKWSQPARSTLRELAKAAAENDAKAEAKVDRIARHVVVLLLHDVALLEITTHHARAAAQRDARRRALEGATLGKVELQHMLEEHAKEEVVKMARLQLASFEPMPTWFKLKFRATSKCVACVVALAPNGRELTETLEAKVVVITSGEANLKLDEVFGGAGGEGRSASQASAASTESKAIRTSDVQVSFGRHHIVEPKSETHGEVDLQSETIESSCGDNLSFEPLDEDCEFCNWELLRRRKCCGSFKVFPANSSAVSSTFTLQCGGIVWSAEEEAHPADGTCGEFDKDSYSAKSVAHVSGNVSVLWEDALETGGARAQVVSLGEVDALEQALLNSVDNDTGVIQLAKVFLSTIGASVATLSAEEATKRSRLMVIASKILRSQKRRRQSPFFTDQPSTRSDTLSMKPASSVASGMPLTAIPPVEALRAAMGSDPLDADELSWALDGARRAGVDPLLLSQAECMYLDLLSKHQKAMALVQALESGMIKSLRVAIADAEKVPKVLAMDFPDADGVGVLTKAKQLLEAKENNALSDLHQAVKVGGALRLERALSQALEGGIADSDLLSRAQEQLRNTEDRKRLISLLKAAMTARDAELLRSAIGECQTKALGDAELIDLTKARGLLNDLLAFQNNAKRPVAGDGDAVRQMRAMTALRAVLFQDAPDASMLRLALQQALEANCSGWDVQRAQTRLAEEEKKEKALECLRRLGAFKDVGQLSAAIRTCRDTGVDSKGLLSALTQLMDELAHVARRAGDHGLGSAVLAEVERQRRDLHDEIQMAHGWLRIICRVRPGIGDEISASDCHPKINRVDRFNVSIGDDVIPFHVAFGPDCIQAEIFNDLRGLVQSAIDGCNVLFLACGPACSGKTTTLCGGSSSVSRGLIPRAIDELFSIRDRDNWRADLAIDVQMVEVLDRHNLNDLLISDKNRPSKGAFASSVRTKPTVCRVPVAHLDGSTSLQDDAIGAFSAIVEGAATRRVGGPLEFQSLLKGGFALAGFPEEACSSSKGVFMMGNASQSCRRDASSRHVVLIAHLTRTNKANCSSRRSKLMFVDLAACGEGASVHSNEAYTHFGKVLNAVHSRQRPPFRDHVLMRLLQDGLEGRAKTALILTLPPGLPLRDLGPHAAASYVEAEVKAALSTARMLVP